MALCSHALVKSPSFNCGWDLATHFWQAENNSSDGISLLNWIIFKKLLMVFIWRTSRSLSDLLAFPSPPLFLLFSLSLSLPSHPQERLLEEGRCYRIQGHRELGHPSQHCQPRTWDLLEADKSSNDAATANSLKSTSWKTRSAKLLLNSWSRETAR